MTLFESLLALLSKAGVQHIFGVPGDALNPLTDALRKQKQIAWVRTAHEEGAAFAASGAAKLSGRLQVCAGTVGPGALHLINGLADAQKDGAPVLAILGQIPQEFRGSDYHQEIDLRRVFAPVVGHVVELESASAAPHALLEAINYAIANREVSALIVPSAVGRAEVDGVELEPLDPGDLGHLHPSPSALAKAVRLLEHNSQVTIFAGDGSRGAETQVIALGKRLSAPIIRSLKARDLYPDDHELVCGELGVVGSRRAVAAMKHCEVLLMIGTDFPYREWYNPDCTAIQIDRRAAVIGRRSPRTIALHADANVAVRSLLDMLPSRGGQTHKGVLSKVWEHVMDDVERVDAGAQWIRPQALVRSLAESAPEDAIFTCDTGTSTVWAARHLHLQRGQRITFCANLGSMAYALPAAVGSALVEPKRCVVALTGDGAFNMLMGELMTAVRQRLNLKVVILDNSKAGLIQLEQESEGFPETDTGQRNPDYAQFARACGATGIRVTEPVEVDASLARLFAATGPAVLDVKVDPDALVFPPKVSLTQAWSFGLARAKELFVDS